jgi:stage II sporulation protein B
MNRTKMTIHFDHRGRRIVEAASNTSHENKVIPFKQQDSRIEGGKLQESIVMNDFSTEFSPWQTKFEENEELAEQVTPIPLAEAKAEEAVKPSNNTENVQEKIHNQGGGHVFDKETRMESSVDRHSDSQHTEAMWELNRDQIWVDETFQGVMVRKRPPTSWWKAIISISAAIVTGVALGFFLLNVINKDSGQLLDPNQSSLSSTSNGSNAAASQPNNNASGVEGIAKPASGSIQGSTVVNVQMDAFNYSILQHGVFSSKTTGQAAINELSRKGYKAAFEQGDKMIVYTGIASTKAEAQRLAAILKANKIDIYVKSVDLPALSQILWNGSKPESVKDFLTSGDKLIRMMSGVAIAHLEETDLTPFEAVTMKAIQDAHSTWKASASEIGDGGEAISKLILDMTQAMNTAVAAFGEYEKKPSAIQLWETQSAMMQYIFAQKQLYAAISPSS